MFDRSSIDVRSILEGWMRLGAERPYMASVMGICAGLMGPKSENVSFSSVVPLLFEGSRAARRSQPNEQLSNPRGPTSKKSRFVIKNASCRSSELCFLLRWGGHFHKNHENM